MEAEASPGSKVLMHATSKVFAFSPRPDNQDALASMEQQDAAQSWISCDPRSSTKLDLPKLMMDADLVLANASAADVNAKVMAMLETITLPRARTLIGPDKQRSTYKRRTK
jgi:hypothetical protein